MSAPVLSSPEPTTVLYFGTPDFAADILKHLVTLPNIKVLGVVTQPDTPQGRGRVITPSPTKTAALSLGLPVYQPATLKTVTGATLGDPPPDGSRELSTMFYAPSSALPVPDLCIVVAYGKIIPARLLELPPLGFLNVHASLLPRWRGAAPIERAILAGDTQTGISIMKLDKGLDTGPVFATASLPINSDEGTASLKERMTRLSCELLGASLPEIISGKLAAVPQPEVGITYAEKWEVSDSTISWSDSAESILRRIRAASEDGARTLWKETLIKIYAARIAPAPPESEALAPGTIYNLTSHSFGIMCGDGQGISPVELQRSGKRRMTVREFLQARPFGEGDRFT